MFSWILEFLSVVKKVQSKVQEEKTKRIKRRTKDEALKESDSIAEAHEKTKNSENVVEAEKKSKKLKGQKILIDVLKFVAELFEVSIIGTLIFIGILIFFVALVVILIMFILYGFLTNTGIIPDGGIFSPSQEDCIQGTQALQSAGYDLSSMNQLSGTMTEHQKNLMRFLALYEDYLSRDDVWADPQYVDEIKSILGKDKLFNFMHGFSFCETGGYFTVQYNYSKDKNILEYSTTHNAAYCFLGLKKGDKFDKYYGGYGSAMSTDSFVDYVKNKYVPKDYQVTDNNYAPYGAATQLSLVGTESLRPYNDDVETLLPALMDAYGIQENRDELMAYCKLFMAAAYYHSHFSGTEDLLSIWCAIWSATSDVDANRGFDNIKIVYDELYLGEKMYGEPTGRQFIFGTGGSNNLVVKWDQTCDTYFQINGKDLNVTLWTWVRDNCSNNTEFMRAANAYLIAKGGTEEVNNAHYGLFAYLITPKIVSDLGGTVPVVTGGNIDDCDCYNGGTSGSAVNVGNRDFSNVKHGEIQGNYSQDIVNKMMADTTFSKHFGKLNSLKDTSAILAGDVTYEEWRLNSKWQVPYQHQNSKFEDWAFNIDFGGVRMYNKNKLGIKTKGAGNLCPLMMQSYIFSAMTGKAINVAELTALGRAYGGSGRYWEAIAQAAGDSGFYIRGFEYNPRSDSITATGYATADAETNAPILYPEKNGVSSKDIVAMINYVLDNNGIVGVNVRGKSDTGVNGCVASYPTSQFAHSNHYFCITHRDGDTYYTHSASSPSLDIKGHSIDDIIGKDGSALCVCWMYNMFFAYNPSLTLVDNTQSSGVQTGGTQTGGTQTTNVSAFENFLFIGDSFTVQLNSNLNSEMSKHIVMAAGGAYPDQYVKDSDADGKIDFLTTSITVGTGKLKDTVGPLPDNVNGVVVLIGTNQVTRNDQIEDTKVLLQTLVDKYDVPIYVQKVFPKGYYKDPVNYHRNNGNYQWNADDENAATDTFNQEIANFCSTNPELNFIDTTAGLVENGYLKYTGDGLHLYTTEKTDDGRTTFEVWYENIKNAVLNGGSTSTNSSSVNCISTGSNSGVSTAGAIDLDLDVDDVTAKIKAGSWGHSYTKTRTKDEIKFIVVHYWGSQSKSPAFALRKDSEGNESGLIHLYEIGKMNRESDGKTYMAQYVVDREGIYRTAPDLVNVQHAGGDYYNGGDYYTEVLKPLGMEKCSSNNSIGIEAANSDLNDTGPKKLSADKGFYVYEKGTIENLISLTKALMIEYNIDVDHIYRHYDCSMKTCPAPFIDDKSLWVYNASDYDKGESQNWKAFKECLTSDTIDWSKFNDHVVDNIK